MQNLFQNKNTTNDAYFNSVHYFSKCATGETLAERHAAAWHAAKAFFNEPHAYGGPILAWQCMDLLRVHAANGPRRLQISRLDCWRIVVDVMHFGGVRV
ncbi:hypothetical protein Q3O97_23495 [Ralstonia pseudosolanacearum]|uniref:hypothetical protein n=1 Tax=Ralstonia pseudosolanacearum TaxID=1310165 RepID=UPI002709522E|nr:hypothetical protein [Ralstonia pseudosolanacearum]MDO3618801.1 hypothetical protein [Ralstonia pseudosolanacearum]